MTSKVHYLHPGQWPVHIGFTDCPRAFAREMKRLKVNDPPEMTAHPRGAAAMHTFTSSDTPMCFIITMPPPGKTRSREQIAAIIAHEALHVVQGMEEELFAGGRFDHESAAYLLQYIVQHCLQIIWKSGKTRKSSP